MANPAARPDRQVRTAAMRLASANVPRPGHWPPSAAIPSVAPRAKRGSTPGRSLLTITGSGGRLDLDLQPAPAS